MKKRNTLAVKATSEPASEALPPLKVLFKFDALDWSSEVSSRLMRDASGRFYLNGDDGPYRVSAAEAGRWYVRCRAFASGWSGSVDELVIRLAEDSETAESLGESIRLRFRSRQSENLRAAA